ncbi:acyl-acyl carrier protein thioesterase ATL4, chloroplastic-like [Salvia miltiorrhiza]|uniref:acyl-acyl carrier protein thioesterase ATL4, chloroplastic-like n=1 Tax=Salvia miltiorrhiza TaxID=226208 RepID=UPI0025AC0531|nr:acyl-acyl carrier protein thioesterase ATL4, chloroplastic-like [Salvia miltiorrhiza]
MLHNSLTHITPQTAVSFPVVLRQHAEQPPPLVRSCGRLSQWSLPPVRSSATVAFINKIGGGKGMSWFHEVEQEVREYELDQFGVVNNAVYSNLCEDATYKLLDEIGFDADIKLAVSEVTIKYISPLKRKDRYVLKLRLYDYSTTRFFFEDQVLKLPDHELVACGKATLVLLDGRLRPSRITPAMISKLNQFLQTHTN